jgi:predicted RNA-binding Zn-ribbon protein involved in translation (DUF1610 family)
MADIKVTLSRDSEKHAGTLEEEASWLESEESLIWPFSGRPARNIVGGWIYFVFDGRVRARAALCGARKQTSPVWTYREARIRSASGWWIEYRAPMEMASHPAKCRGFQSPRYVTANERRRFENCFRVPFTIPKWAFQSEMPTPQPEGKRVLRWHFDLERDSAFIEALKIRRGQLRGELHCEACGIEFVRMYGSLGVGFIECHHTRPLSTLTKATRPRESEIAFLCPNCHRMIHRSRPLMTVRQLRLLIEERRGLRRK